MIRPVQLNDAAAIAEIYNHYILHSTVTFEKEIVSSEQMAHRISNHSSHHPWLVLEENKAIIAYAFATPWKGRAAYQLSVETSIYLSFNHQGKGIGTRLYTQLIETLKLKNFHSLLGGIALPNEKSIRLHQKLGFKKVAHLKEVGYKFDRWVDVTYWQILL